MLPKKESKWVSIIKDIAKSKCEYCKVIKKDGYQWIYDKNMKIISKNGNEFLTGKSPFEYDLEIPIDQIKDLVPLKTLFSETKWKYHSGMQLEDFNKMREILFDAIANGKPIWVAYRGCTRFLSHLECGGSRAPLYSPHIGLGHCIKYGLSEFRAYCSNRKAIRIFATDYRLKELKVLDCDHVYFYSEAYGISFALLIMDIYKDQNGCSFFENADKILEIMPKKERENSITQVNFANYQVLKGCINKAVELYQQKPYDYFISPSKTWGEECIADIKYFINLFKERQHWNNYYGINLKILLHNFNEVLNRLEQSNWMRIN